MHALHEYVAKQVADRLKARRVVVWYDAPREFAPFVREVCRDAPAAGLAEVTVGGVRAMLAEYDGSFFALRALVEPVFEKDEPEPLLVYVPGIERDEKSSVLLELQKAGEAFDKRLGLSARNVLRKRYTEGVIDELVPAQGATYEDLARVCSRTGSGERPSMLRSVYHDLSGSDAILAAFLADEARDPEIESKQASSELGKLLRSRLGLEVPADASLHKTRALALRYVLGAEFRLDLRCAPPSALDGVPAPRTKEEEQAVRDIARRLRLAHAGAYPAIADRVESELGLASAPVPAEALGSIDTFRFEERALLRHCAELVTGGQYAEAMQVIGERESSYWLDRDLGRKSQWEACRCMAELGEMAGRILADQGTPNDAARWVEVYTSRDGWHRLDRAERRLEEWIARLDEEPDERALGVVRQRYEAACAFMAERFSRALAGAQWSVPGALHQTRVFADVVAQEPRPVAYFLVDAMRFEMGLELSERLPPAAEVAVRPAIACLPSITPIGMAALLPGASGSFRVVERGGKLGAEVDGAFLPDLASRKKHFAARAPGTVDLPLDELLGLSASKLAKRVDGAAIVVVRSQEIDHAGEAGFTFQARRVIDNVIDNLARAIRKLAAAGVAHAVVTADHGHLFFPADRDASLRIDPPGGGTVDLHRRSWIGRGGATPPGCVRAAAPALGYDSDLDFVFPQGATVFKAGGDLAFHHGGTSLQELVIPVVTVRLATPQGGSSRAGPVSAAFLPEAITNRIFTVVLEVSGPNLSLFGAEALVRPLLLSGGKRVGDAGMAVGAELDRKTGCVRLEPGKPATVALRLIDESVASVRVVVQDPSTDAELYRSPTDIPVRLGI